MWKRTVFGTALLCLLSAACPLVFAQNFAGTYVRIGDSKEYLTLSPDGTFFLKQRKKPSDLANPFQTITGHYQIQGTEIILRLPGGGEATGKIQENIFEDSDGKKWAKDKSKIPLPQDTDRRPTEGRGQRY
ncbi:MAG TPA: hypothetical protein PLM79_01140 [Syntrophobacteraceae bacterium]|nr:hypothetical protein [Syntrophobacteraceae bacterium]